ncbi:MAG: pilus assembly protein TadG-related protein [Chloroflexota bacterium]|nr:pilus assembly protein TadG-related protein [Chloroflexota bacterium]
MTKLQRFFGPKEDGGQAIVLLAIVMLALIMVVGLAVDAGQLYSAKRSQQEAADAAAFAGGVVLYQGGTTAQAIAAATADATRNGYTNNSTTVVTVESPPLAGPYLNKAKYVRVTIVAQVRTALVPAESVLNPVTARGTAGADPNPSPFAIVALKAAGPCITMGGSGVISVPNPDANTGGMIQANCTGTSIQFNGGCSTCITDSLGVRTVGTTTASKISGSLTQNASKVADPFAAFPKPVISNIVSNSAFSVPASACNAATPLTAGTYIGGITNSNNCNVYLGDGVFIIKGGGFSQNSSSGSIVTLSGATHGAMLYNTHSNYPGLIGGGSCGSVQAQSGGGFNIWAIPAGGTYSGMALYQDAACTQTLSIQSNGSYNFHGTLYAPTALLDLQSQSSLTMDAQIVVSAISFSSSGNLTVNYHTDSSALSGLPTLVD